MKEKAQRFDWWLFLITLVLLGCGIVLVFDASYPHAIAVFGDNSYWVRKQITWAILGLGVMFIMSRIGYWKWRGFGTAAMIGCVLLLLAVFAIGDKSLGAARWIGWGPIKIQPSEFAKLGVILFLCQHLAARPRRVQTLAGLAPLLGVSLGAVVLVERQPDLGTAITLLITIALILYAAGTKGKWIAATLAICGTLALGAILIKGTTNNYRWQRMTTFVNPAADPLKTGYQITHSTIALGTGGVTGVGFGESREKLLGNLPMQRTDFIFAILGEEFGLLGTGTVILLFGLLAGRGFWIAARTKDPYGSMVATGITGMITAQALLNIAVFTASMPVTGIPLPFLSYGGSSLVVTLASIGILLNISRHPERQDMRPSARRMREKSDASLNDWQPRRSVSGARSGA